MKVINDAKDGVNHEKMCALLKEISAQDKKELVDDIKSCGELDYANVKDKIDHYVDCIENNLEKHCSEIKDHRKEFHDKFEGDASEICK